MRLFHSRTLGVVTAILAFTFAVIDAFPVYGPPAFRYTGSDPKHLVWNFGWPFTWVIYDKFNPPNWFSIPGSGPLLIALIIQVAIIGACPVLSWMIRKKDA